MKFKVDKHSLYADKFPRLFYLLVRAANYGRWCRWWLQSDPDPVRPLSRRMAPPPPAGIIWCSRRRKTYGAPPSQPKLSAAAAAEIFTARR